MTLSDVFESEFRGDIRFRGVAYVEAERVEITRVTADSLEAVVRDGSKAEYETELVRDDGQLRMLCNCPKCNERPDGRCKYLWATLLAADRGGYVTASPKQGYIPPFAAEIDEFEGGTEWDFPLDDDEFADAPVSGGRAEQATAVQPRVRPWLRRLEALKKGSDAEDVSPTGPAREREIFYEIDVEQTREVRQVVLEVAQRQRRKNGQWGKLKPLKLKPGQLENIEREEDLRILANLCGGVAERTKWYAQQAELQGAINRFRLAHPLSEMLLPLLCETGRLRYRGDDESAETLSWDDGPPWEFCVAVVFDSEEDCWRLQGRLSRESESLGIDETVAIVPGGFVFTASHVARLEDFGAAEWVDLVADPTAVLVPPGDEQELVDRLFDMPNVPRLELPAELQLEEVEADPVPQLIVHSPHGPRWQRERLRGEVHFEYLGATVRSSSRQRALVQRDQGRCILRNRQRESEAWSLLQSLGFRRLLDRRRGEHDVEIAARELGPAVRVLVAEGWSVRADGKQVHQAGTMHFRVQSGIDWFELHADVDFDGRSISFPEILSALSRGDSTVRLDDGSLGILPENWLEQYGLLAGIGVADGDHVRFGTNQVGLLDALLASQESVDYDDHFQELRDKLKSFEGVAPVSEPQNFQGNLRGYQRAGLGWLKFLQDFRFGGCLADDMGLGKTIQVLALLMDRVNHQKQRGCPSLIVVPKSLLFNWQEEAERFTPRLRTLEYTGPDRASLRDQFHKYDIVLTTYGTLRRDVMVLKDVEFEYVVLDEAQTIKNAGSQVAKASRLLHGHQRLALSGTPIENHLGDLWSIFEFLNPGMLGRSSIFKLYADDPEDKQSRHLLSQWLRPFILRRTKRQVANDLPEKVEQTIHCSMGSEQRQLYCEMRDHYRAALLSGDLMKSKMHVLEALLRLRQAACHPGLLDKSKQDDDSAKLDVLCPHLEELLDEGHKTLVFSQFTSLLSIVKRHLDTRNIGYEYLDGQTRDRKTVVDRFQNDAECGVFLVSLKAGGLGLNLTAADYVFLLDPWWNPAVETQAIDRVHRVGQTRKVFAYRLICRDTVEEKIAELQTKKRDLADAILQENGSLLKDMTAEDLNLLLS